MQKLILISSEKSIENEIGWVNEIMEFEQDARFHLRKPNWSEFECKRFLKEIDLKFHKRISVHQHHVLKSNFPKVSLHFNESIRKQKNNTELKATTSFHCEEDAIIFGADFEYFFCSPIFKSISKTDYLPKIEWNINEWSTELKRKAVALGGLNKTNIALAKKKGFQNVAILGAVWMSKNPLETFKVISELCQK